MSILSKINKAKVDKEITKLIDFVDATERKRDTWEDDAEKFVNGGKLPATTAVDIDNDIAGAERIVLDKQKKLKPKDDQAEEIKKIAAYIQTMKIRHRKYVGELFSQFSSLDEGVSGQVTLACKEADTIMRSYGKTAQDSLKSILTGLKERQQDANKVLLKVGGNVQVQRTLAEGTGKLLGRTVRSTVDAASYANTVKEIQTEAGQMIAFLEKVIATFKK